MRSILAILSICAVNINAQFGAAGQNEIVKAHNDLRSAIARGQFTAKTDKKTSATNMRKMKWDTSIANSAQNYANSCPTGHSKIAGLGENLYWYWTSGNLGDLNQYGAKASAAWAKEFQDFGWKYNKLDNALFNTGVGHATQMAWANTNLIGCGVKNCGKDPKNKMNKVTVVCQYKAPGNYVGSNIYESGKTCSVCPSGTRCESTSGLCY